MGVTRRLDRPRIQDLAKGGRRGGGGGGGGGAVLREGRHIDNECMRSQGRIRRVGGGGGCGVVWVGGGGSVRFRPDTKREGRGAVRFTPDTKSGGGEGVLSASGPIRKVDWGEGGGGGCLPYDDLYLRARARA